MTIEGAETSQFQNHIRAITGMPLGSTAARGHYTMVNLIGSVPDMSELQHAPGIGIHLYDKRPRPGRKLGHITFPGTEAHRVAVEQGDFLAGLRTNGPARLD